MSDSIERDSRSMSHDYEDSEKEDHGKDDGSGRGKPGRKKNPDSAAARRDQNRIAQREFRLRKQQRIRDLEARVEILSGSRDETFNELRNVVKDLMQENQNLRNIIRSLGSYIGEGLGGVLPSIGFERPQEFVEFINRAETDTAYEGFQRRKKAAQAAAAAAKNSAGSSGVSIDLSKKRSISEDLSGSRKRIKDDHLGLNGSGHSGVDADSSRYPAISVPLTPSTGGTSFYSTVGGSTQGKDLFSELLQRQGGSGSGAASSMYMTGPVSDTPGFTASPPSASSVPQYPSAFHPPISVPSGLSSQPFLSSMTSGVPAQTPSTASEPPEQEEGIDDPKLLEATKLIHYHLDNYKRNNAYCLPQSLRPTLVQRTVPHESVIDGIPHPELRDRMILLRGRFDLVDALHDYTKTLTLHGDDVLAHSNWEIGENWLRRYGFLVDQPVLNICNRWRRERGESELLLADIQQASQDGVATA